MGRSAFTWAIKVWKSRLFTHFAESVYHTARCFFFPEKMKEAIHDPFLHLDAAYLPSHDRRSRFDILCCHVTTPEAAADSVG